MNGTDQDDESNSSDWGAFGAGILVAALHTAAAILISVNIGWLSLLDRNVLDLLLPSSEEAYSTDCTLDICGGADADEGISFFPSGTGKRTECVYNKSVDTAIPGGGSCGPNRRGKDRFHIPRLGNKPYCWRSKAPEDILLGAFYNSGVEPWVGQMMFWAYSHFRKFLAELLTLGGITRHLRCSVFQPLITNLSFGLAHFVVVPAAGVLTVIGALFASLQIPYGNVKATWPILQGCWNIMGFFFGGIIWGPCAAYNCLYMYLCVFLWVVFAAPFQYSAAGDLKGILSSHQETYGVIFLGLVLAYGGSALASPVFNGFLISYIVYVLIFIYRRL